MSGRDDEVRVECAAARGPAAGWRRGEARGGGTSRPSGKSTRGSDLRFGGVARVAPLDGTQEEPKLALALGVGLLSLRPLPARASGGGRWSGFGIARALAPGNAPGAVRSSNAARAARGSNTRFKSTRGGRGVVAAHLSRRRATMTSASCAHADFVRSCSCLISSGLATCSLADAPGASSVAPGPAPGSPSSQPSLVRNLLLPLWYSEYSLGVDNPDCSGESARSSAPPRSGIDTLSSRVSIASPSSAPLIVARGAREHR